ncbi:MAG TPA: ATPase domain-containing protein [Steroidobacteraceae bacterium]|jgi:circadian clock protein KaiC|nr:ATPase domain-containing protein [Steroidobacteraceae bacterium]
MTSAASPSTSADVCRTGIEGFDHLVGGGLPRNCFYLVQGDPGSGKTTFALQFLLEGLRSGERAFYITLSETRGELERVALSHSWSLEHIPLLELSAIDSLLRPESQTTVFHPSEVELSKITGLVLAEVRKHKPSRVVFDSLSEFRLVAETPLRYRRQLLSLKQELTLLGCTVLLLDDKMDSSRMGPDPHVLSITHGVIEMEQLSPDYGKSRRRLRIVKVRGVRFHEGFHDYIIETGGLRVFPRLTAADSRNTFRREPVSSGVDELDSLLGGGLDFGSTTLIQGQAGTGKSTLAVQYASHLAAQDLRSNFFCFDETIGIVLDRAEKLGLAFPEYVRQGVITVQQIDPAEISPGEFAHRVIDAVDGGSKLVVIDTLNGYLNAMPGERYLITQLHELSTYLNQLGVLTIFVLTLHGILAEDAPVDVSYLADTVLNLRFFEVSGSLRTALSVLKKRSGPHERTIREFLLEAGRGIRVGAPLSDFHHILSGSPEFVGDRRRMLQNHSDDE